MATFDLGFLVRGASPTAKTSSMPAGRTGLDIFKFTTGNIRENVHITTGGSDAIAFALALFEDANGNGTLDNSGDRIVLANEGTPNVGDGPFESMDIVLSQGTYFARTTGFSNNDFGYLLLAQRSKTGQANPLAGPEIPLGQISQDLQRRDRVNDKDTADNFAFTLDGNSVLNIGVRELGNKNKGDVNIRVVQDLNGNGVVDNNEVVVRGTSTNKGNIDAITGLKGAGDYILQVCQSKGSTRFEVNFDHSAA